jgi:hypothetical protein
MVGTYYPALRFLNMPIINGGHTFKEFYSKADGALTWVLTFEKQKTKDYKQGFNRHWTRKVPVATRFQRFMGMVNFLAVHCSQCPANSEGLKLCQTSGFSERLSGDESHPQISTKYFRQALESVIGGLPEGKIGSWVQLPDERAVASFFLGGKADRHNAARLITQLEHFIDWKEVELDDDDPVGLWTNEFTTAFRKNFSCVPVRGVLSAQAACLKGTRDTLLTSNNAQGRRN